MSKDKKMTDYDDYMFEDDSSLNSLISNALNKKQKISMENDSVYIRNDGDSLIYETSAFQSVSPQRRNSIDQAEKLSVDQIVNETISKKKKKTSADSEELSDEQTMSIEQMVANAMEKKKLASMDLNPERTATSADIVPGGAAALYQDDMFDGSVGNFFVRNKKKIIVILSIILVFTIIITLALSVLNKYFNLFDKDSGFFSDIGTSAIDPNDTLNVSDYEKKLLEQLKSGDEIMSSDNVTNILLIGEDLRDTSGDTRGNTDVMMLISLNSETKEIIMTSFMRDIYLQIPGHYSTRLNAAFEMGGSELLADTIKQNFGINIDRYVLVNFYSFIDIVEAVGGLDFDVTDNEAAAMTAPLSEQNRLMDKSFGTDYLSSGGQYHLNGNQALAYSRIRKGGTGDDYGRTQRQRDVIAQMVKKSKNLSLTEINALLEKVLPNVKTDLTKKECMKLIYSAFVDYKNYDVKQLRIPADNTFTDQRIRGSQVLCPNFAANIKILQQTIYGESNISDDDVDSEGNQNFEKTTIENNNTYVPPTVTKETYTSPTTTEATTPKPKTTSTTTTTKAKTTKPKTTKDTTATTKATTATTTTPTPSVTPTPPVDSSQ